MRENRIANFLKPHKTVPHTPWRGKSRWDLSPSRFAILSFGLSIFGLGDSLLIQGNVGNAPWTVFAQGLTLKAIEWYQKAADQGNLDAQYNLGCMYQSGIGTAKDISKAIYWFEQPTQNGVS